jgi:hypothetical protein
MGVFVKGLSLLNLQQNLIITLRTHYRWSAELRKHCNAKLVLEVMNEVANRIQVHRANGRLLNTKLELNGEP